MKPDGNASSNASTDVITVRGLTFTYPKAHEPAVRGIEFAVRRGEIFGFLGPSGAGKSTTQKILIGLLRGHGGAATVWGRDPAAWGSEYYERIGVSFELPNHYQKLTGLENLQFFSSLYSGETADAFSLLDGSASPAMPTREFPSIPRECRCGSPSRARWSTTQNCCFSTSPLRPGSGQCPHHQGHHSGAQGAQTNHFPDHTRHGDGRRIVRPGGLPRRWAYRGLRQPRRAEDRAWAAESSASSTAARTAASRRPISRWMALPMTPRFIICCATDTSRPFTAGRPVLTMCLSGSPAGSCHDPTRERTPVGVDPSAPTGIPVRGDLLRTHLAGSATTDAAHSAPDCRAVHPFG